MSQTKKTKGYHHGDLRRALLKAAWTLLRKRGLKELTLREVARQVGVTHAAPYHHFPDRDALLEAMAGEAFAALDQAMRAAKAALDAGGDELFALGRAYIDFARTRPEALEVMFRRADAAPGKGFSELGASAFQHLVDAVINRQRAGLAPAGDPQMLALSAWSLVHGFSVLWVEGPLGAMPPYAGKFELLRDELLRSCGRQLEAAAKHEQTR